MLQNQFPITRGVGNWTGLGCLEMCYSLAVAPSVLCRPRSAVESVRVSDSGSLGSGHADAEERKDV